MLLQKALYRKVLFVTASFILLKMWRFQDLSVLFNEIKW